MKLSPSAIVSFRTCRRLYAFTYVEGLRGPSSPAQQFGTEVHKQLERWLTCGTPPDDSPPGRVAEQGLGWLPAPSDELLVEHPFSIPLEEDLELMGFIDCVRPGPVPLLIDHKSCADLRWAKTEAQLRVDPQALVYSLWAMLEWGAPEVQARWTYFSATTGGPGPRKPRGAKPVEVLLAAEDPAYQGAVEVLLADCYQMAALRRAARPALLQPPTPSSCGLYGGCPFLSRCNLTQQDRLGAYFGQKNNI